MKNMKKIVTVLGARPQFIKAAVLSRLIRGRGDFNAVIVHTGQHFDANMSEVFFQELEIPRPAYNLEVNGKGHGVMTGQMMEKLEPVLQAEMPDLVVVYGDTNSTLAGALVARKLQIPVAHVEAGLRSFNMEMPEEVNRIITDRISDLLFCPTRQAVLNLKKEGFDSFGLRVVQTGDIMKDAVSFFRNRAVERFDLAGQLGIEGKRFILATIHRQENTSSEERLRSIFRGLESLSADLPVVLPLHPRTRAALKEFGISSSLHFIDPVGYKDMQWLLSQCALVVTDSGGLQKEAYFHKKPSLVVREQTEWVELLEAGLAKLVGSEPEDMRTAFEAFGSLDRNFDQDLYGKEPGEKIYQEIFDFLNR
jgi:UDP-GlcNAc3NAcA epimerase